MNGSYLLDTNIVIALFSTGNISSAIQMSFSGNGRPLLRSWFFMEPYSRATAPSQLSADLPAAIAQQRGCVLATRDVHFQEIDGLKVETW